MSLKKQTNVRTGKMVRELMLADEDVTASLIMVYSNNGVNEEIKIEGLNPKSNEELFLSGTVDWNKSVIYKIVDFSGKAEVGKALLTAMNKNNVTLEIERVMWSKGNKEEEVEKEEEEEKLTLVHTELPEAKPLKRPEVQPPVSVERVSSVQNSKPLEQTTPLKKPEPVEPTISIEKSKPIEQKMSIIKPKPVEFQEVKNEVASNTQSKNTTLQENYVRLVAKAVEVCQDYELGIDLDNSIENLKTELQHQGIEVTFNAEIMNVVNQLRALSQKGINIEKVLNLL
ncbi:hypothetical protein ACFDTO_24570 [Microbacteriaceae bacterium 4G12]